MVATSERFGESSPVSSMFGNEIRGEDGGQNWDVVSMECTGDWWATRQLAAGRGRGLERRPAAEMLEPRCLMDGSGLSVAGSSLKEKFQKSFTATVASFTTSNLSERASDFHATIEWGDGSSSSGIIKANKKHKGEFTVTGTHVYANGVEDQEMTTDVSDKLTGQSESTTVLVDVLGSPVELGTNGDLQAYEGQPFDARLAFLTLASGTSNVNAVATITYPDGTSETDSFESAGNDTLQVFTSGDYKFPHSTPPAPTQTVSVDFSGSFVYHHKTLTFHDSEQDPVDVLDSPLTPYTPSGTSTTFIGSPGVPLIATMYFLDANTLAQASEYTGTVNWGDGNTSPLTSSNFVVLGQVNDQTEVVVTCTHAYQGGPFPISITVKDDGGQSVMLKGTATLPLHLQMLGLSNAVHPGQPIDFDDPDPPPIAVFQAAAPLTPSDFSNSIIIWGDGTSSTAYISYEHPNAVATTGINYFVVNFVLPYDTGHIYQSAGSYDVTLKIIGPNGDVLATGTIVENIYPLG